MSARTVLAAAARKLSRLLQHLRPSRPVPGYEPRHAEQEQSDFRSLDERRDT